MWGHCLLLLSPDRKERKTLLVIDQQRYSDAQSLLRSRRPFWRQYRRWVVLGFAVAHTNHPQVRPVVHSVQLAEPGSLVDVRV